MKRPEFIKICGLSEVTHVDAVIESDATHLGLIFYEKSPRHISLEQAEALAKHAGDRIKKVAVTVNADDAYLAEIVAASNPDLLQLHGSETPDRVDEVKKHYSLPVIKALAVRERSDLEKAKSYIGHADYFLFDAKPPKGADLPGGNGVAFDWEIMDQWPSDVPYILSGGLNIENISDAISQSGAFGIDVSSGVESMPGKKDTNMIRSFLRIANQKDRQS